MELNKIIPIIGQVRAVTDEQIEKRFSEFVLSSEAVDTYGTVFRGEGWRLERYTANPVVTYAHDDNSSNPDIVIGTSEVFREGNLLIGRVFYEPEDINPLAEKIRKKVNHGTLRMASINAIPSKGHWGKEENGEKRDVLYFDEQELFAWSIVPIGSNPDALKRNAEAITAIKTEFTRNIDVVVETTDDNKKLLSIREAQLIINKNVQ